MKEKFFLEDLESYILGENLEANNIKQWLLATVFCTS